MLIKARNEDKKEILDAIRENVEQCLYIYIDISYYGLEYPYIDVWFEKDHNKITCVVMKYHDNFQLYLTDDYNNISELIDLLNIYRPPMINATKNVIERIKPYVFDKYHSLSGKIMRLNHSFELDCSYDDVELAKLDDIRGIAELLCSDEYYSESYTENELIVQLTDRLKSNMGRSYIIKNNDKVIAHNSISAQIEDICIASLLIVDKNYRNITDYGFKMEDFIINKINDEGKRLYAFLTDDIRIKILEMVGNEVVSEYGKLVLIVK